MNNREEIIAQLQLLNTLISDSTVTVSSSENKKLRELHAEVTTRIKKKFPYTPMDMSSEAF